MTKITGKYYTESLSWIGCLCFLIALCGAALAQNAQRIPDTSIVATQIAQVAGHVWLSTPQGAYRIDGDRAIRFPDNPTNVTAVCDVDGQPWLATTDGAYRIDGDRAVRVPSESMVVTSVVKAGGNVWFATPKGAFRLVGDPLGDPSSVTLKRVPDQDLDVMEVDPVGGDVWLGMFGGAYFVTGDTAQRLPDVKYALNQIMDVNGTAYIATDAGPFIAHGSQVEAVKGISVEVFHMENLRGEVWFVGRDGAYRVTGDTAQRIPDTKLAVSSISYAAGHVWVASRTGAYRIDGDTAARTPDRSLDVAQVADVFSNGKHEAWLAAKDGAYRVDGDNAVRVPNLNISVRQIAGEDGKPWLATDAGAFVVRGGAAVREPDSDATVLSMRSVNNELWMATTNGVFRVRGSGAPQLSLDLADGGWRAAMQRFLPGGLRVAGRYHVEADTGDDTVPSVAGVGRQDYDRAMRQANFQPLNTLTVDLPAGRRTVYVGVRDRWSGGQYRLTATCVPPGLVLLVLAVVAWTAVNLTVFLLTPYNRLCWALLMSAGWRDYATLGLVPLLLKTSTGARLHVLRPYRRTLLADPFFATASVTRADAASVVPRDIQDDLADGRIVGLNAPRDIDLTGYLRFLAGCYAVSTRSALRPSGVVPVVLDPSDPGQLPGEQVMREIGSLGNVTDLRLAASLVSRQRLLLLMPEGGTREWLMELSVYLRAGRDRALCAVWDPELAEAFGNKVDRIELGIPDEAPPAGETT